MYAWIKRSSDQPLCGEPTPLLTHLAGEFAPRIAALWPAPHAAFVTAAAERRHLVCLALVFCVDDALSSPDDLLNKGLTEAIRLVAPHAPAGLRRALGRLGEVAWSADDYVRPC
jgi:hypothetical protein